jgi:lambda family phage portal protein
MAEIKAKSKRGGARPGAGRPKKADPQNRSFEQALPTYDRPYVYLTSIQAKKELPAWDRMRLMQQSRWAINNSGIAARLVRGISRYSVGNGLVPQARTSKSDWNKRAERLFEDRVATDAFAFTKDASVNFYEAQRLIVEQMVSDGEMFAQLVKSDAGNAMVRLIGAEYVGCVNMQDKDQDGFIDGVKMNEDGKPIAFRVVSDPASNSSDFIDVDAQDIIHIRKLHRYGFTRGVSWMFSTVAKIQDLRDMMDSEQLAAKLNSKIGLVIESPDAGNIGLGSNLRKVGQTTSSGLEEVTFDRLTAGAGTVQLRPGEKLTPHSFDRPNSNFPSWTEFVIREIAWSCGISPELLWNMKDASGAIARHIMQDAEVFFQDIRQLLEYQFCRRFWRYWIWHAIKVGDLEYPGDDWWRCEWIAPQRLSLDFGRDGKLRMDLVRAGLLSSKRYFSELGQDNEAELEDIIRAAATRKKLIAQISKEEGIELDEMEVFPPAPGTTHILPQSDPADTRDALSSHAIFSALNDL